MTGEPMEGAASGERISDVAAARLRSEGERALMEGLFALAPMGIAVVGGQDLVFSYANAAYRTIVDGRDVVGKPLYEALPGIEGQGFDRLLLGVMASGEAFRGYEQAVRLPNHVGDECLYVDFVYSPKHGPSGTIDAVLVSCLDVTERVLTRRRAEALAQRLGQSEERLRRVLEAAGAGLWDLDPATGEIAATPRMVELMGLPEGDSFSLASGLDALVFPGDRERVTDAVQAALEGKEGGRYHVEFRTGGVGNVPRRWVESRAQVRFDAQGKAERLAGVMVDITPRKLAEAEARAKAERLDLLMQNARDHAFLSFATDGTIVGWEGGAEAILGLSADDAIGRNGALIFTPEDQQAGVPERELETAARTGRAEDRRWHLRADGTRFFADGVMSALHGEDGQLRGFAKIFRDRTAQKLVEDALAQSEERLRLALEAGGMGTWELRCATRELATSTPFRVALGLPGESSPTWPDLLAAMTEVDRAAFERAVETTIASGADLAVEARVVWPDGSEHWLDFRARTMREASGSETLTGIALRIDARKAVEAELRTADRRKDEFLLTASHELRTPLNAILGWADLLRRGSLPDAEASKAADTIHRNAKAQSRLIDDVLDGARMLSGKLRLDFQPIDLVGLVSSAVDSLRPTAEVRRIGLTFEHDRFPAPISGDAERLQQVVWNLVSNAIKFTPKGGAVAVVVERAATSTRITVRDTGQGIEAAFLPHVFERFRQADGSTTRRHGGVGLGLALVSHLVEAHGGTVEAESPGVGKGSTFTVVLPVRAVTAEGATGPAPQPSPVPRPGALAGVHVLVVDDEEDARELVATVLRSAGVGVTLASNADEAFETLQTRAPTLLLSDIGMPDTDGYGLIGRVRALENASLARTPAIALTAYAREEDRRLALEAGFDAHLAKPISPDALLETIAAVTGRLPVPS